YLPYKQTAAIYRASKIVLGLQNGEDQVSQRTFEILGTGAFMIASRTDALSNMFQEGKEIALTSSPEETISLINLYLQEKEERLKIGANARKKVLEKYHFQDHLQRVQQKLDRLFLQRRETYASPHKS